MKSTYRFVLCSALVCAPMPALACSSCGCTLSGDSDSQGFSAQPGLRLELRYDYLSQSQLRSGSGTVMRSAIAFPAEREIEQGTVNRTGTLSLDYNPNADWGVNLQLPYLHRAHDTIAQGDTEISSSSSQGIGDVRLIGRYQGFTAARNVGLQFGLKFPTGRYDQSFKSGPQQGQILDRGLQVGSGSTDLLLGGFFSGNLTGDLDYFTQAMVALPLRTADNFRPGKALNVNLGARYVANATFTPELQLNARTVWRDSGDQADADNSGGTSVYLTPGATVVLSDTLNLFGFVQLPVYQRVNGYQLAPKFIVSIGVRYAF